MSSTRRSYTEKGPSLARGPALIIGAVLLIAGLYFLYRAHSFPRLGQFPSGHAHRDTNAFLGIFGVNGWSAELTAVAGGLLLFGAAQHLLAKSASLIVGVVLAAVALIALFDHNSALGLFATNIWTIIGWGVAAALLLINTLMPRRRREVTETAVAPTAAAAPVVAEPVRTRSGVAAAEPVGGEPVADRTIAPVGAETASGGARTPTTSTGRPGLLTRARMRRGGSATGSTGMRPSRRQTSTGEGMGGMRPSQTATGRSAQPEDLNNPADH